jgi:very-long-chain enoyl-CoA reductase
MYYPTIAVWDGVVVALCAALAPLFFVSEGFALMNFGYSKFSNFKDRSTQIPSKTGMFALYFPAALVFPSAAIASGYGSSAWPDTATPFHWTIACLVTAHFIKRCLEVAFLHSFSGHTNLLSCATISALYLATAYMFFFVAAYRLSSPADIASAKFQGFAPNIQVGAIVWLCGVLGNFYHHRLLAQLRAKGDSSYKVHAALPPLYFCNILPMSPAAACSTLSAARTTCSSFSAGSVLPSHSATRWALPSFG